MDDVAGGVLFAARAKPLAFRVAELSTASLAAGVTGGGVDGAGWQPVEDLGRLIGWPAKGTKAPGGRVEFGTQWSPTDPVALSTAHARWPAPVAHCVWVISSRRQCGWPAAVARSARSWAVSRSRRGWTAARRRYMAIQAALKTPTRAVVASGEGAPVSAPQPSAAKLPSTTGVAAIVAARTAQGRQTVAA
jgi:hypothetical protein